MKRIVTILLMFAMLFAIVSGLVACSHEHEFVLSEDDSKAVTCEADGIEVKICKCGEKQETVIPATGHDLKMVMESKPTCTGTGSTDYKCSKCGKMQYNNVEALGHNYEEAPYEPSRVRRCLNEGCTSCQWNESGDKHKETLTFNFTKEDEAAIDAKYDEVKAMVEAAAKYDPALHGYAETGALAEEYKIVDAAHTELYDMVMNAMSQQQLAMVAYYCDMKNTELEETYSYMMDYQTAVIAKFYTLSRPFYDSCYRDFYYYGMTEEEINAFLFDSDAISNPEYTALKERNNAIETEFLALSGSEQSEKLPVLYEEFADNNNKMAQLMGYDNYLEYAYENVYGRDYTYQDVADLSNYIKTHVSPVFNDLYTTFRNLTGYTDEEMAIYNSQCTNPFFTNLEGNTRVNDYIDLMAFTSNPDKNISFSDEFNKLMSEGNMFRGDYEGAFVTTIYAPNLPIAYFGKGYDNCFTIIHEFGHYMNEVYSSEIYADGEYSQSYDLLEMHSQGNELLYLCYLEDNAEYPKVANTLIRTYSLVNMFYSTVAGFTVDSFEQAIYLDTYEGTNADVIMADGTISADEFDLLYQGICTDYGVLDALDGYWEYGMTITSPCYYVSYSVSAISVLQLYEVAHTQGFDVAKEQYLKLFTYVDQDPEMGMQDILSYAGMLSFKDEQLYVNMSNYFAKK
ncbi:MAG: hypothetical protein IJW70_08810 [Clostridia bacterium]|nr:hypothetical protein [Clostridia bacterium]